MAELTKEQLAAIDSYSNDIQTLSDTVTAIRQVPGMYCSGRGNKGYLSLIREIYQNAIDQIIDPTSPADRVTISYNENTLEVIVTDNGKGFPFQDMVRMITALHTSKNYTKKKGEYSSGLHGAGAKVVNALSDEFHVKSFRYDGSAMQLDMKDGYVVGKGPYPIPNKEKKQGSYVSFIPCTEVLGELNLEWKQLYHLVKDILSLTPLGSQVYFTAIDTNGVTHNEHIINKDGIITKLIESIKSPICKPIIIGFDNGDHKLDVAFAYDMGENPEDMDTEMNVTAFCNMCPTVGGDHINGTIDGICRWFSNYMNNIFLVNQKAKDKLKVTSNDIKSGLNIMISGFCLEPTFAGQAKELLDDPSMAPFAKEVISRGLDEWSKANPADLQKLCKFFKDIAELRMKQDNEKAKIVTKYQKNTLNNLPAKYKKPINKSGPDIELIIVEGDSALGSVIKDRDPRTQGAMPVRGKFINAFQASKQKVFENEEVQALTQIIFGQEYRKGFTVEDARVGKIIFLADADIDGSHITALLLRFFVMYYPFLIEAGMVYKAIPPLYSIQEGKKTKYFTDNVDYVKYLQKLFISQNQFCDIKKEPISSNKITSFFVKNADYVYFLEKLASTYSVDPNLTEMILIHYISNGRTIKIDKLKKEITSVYRFMDVYKEDGTIVVKGSIDKSDFVPINDRFLHDCQSVLNIMESNDSLYYTLNGKKASIYNVMKAYDEYTPASRQRYKGLGEMGTGQLGESTLKENRTLIRYTMESAKDTINFIREYESNSKKILSEVKYVDREMLLD